MKTQKYIIFNILRKPLIEGTLWLARNRSYGYTIIKKIDDKYFIGRISFSVFSQLKNLSKATVYTTKPLYIENGYFIINKTTITIDRIHFRERINNSIKKMKITICTNKLTPATSLF